MELATVIGLAKGPIRRSHVKSGDGAAVTGGDLKGKALTIKERIALPILTPVSGHRLPVSSRPFD